jgi:putative inorganic carbon (hco3(-)) transporter
MRSGIAATAPSRRAEPIGPAAPSYGDSQFFAMRLGNLWSVLKDQPASFWCLNVWLFFEYVRPQQIYPSIDVVPFAWTAIWLAVGFFFIEGFRLRRRYPADTALTLFSAVLLLSCFLAAYPDTSFKWLSLYFSWVLLYALITNILTTERRFVIFMLAFMVYSTKMSQHGFRTWAMRGGSFASYGASGAPGWFQNSGEFGIQMCIFFPIAVYFIQALKPYWSKGKLLAFLFMPVSAAISIVASSSRGAVLGLVPVILWMMAKSRKRVKGFLLTAIVAASIWMILPAEQKQRFSEMGQDQTSQSRLAFWKRGLDMLHNNPLSGVGYKNWLPYSMANYEPFIDENSGDPMWQVSHNIFIEVGSELGYPGLLLFVGMIGITFYTNHKTRKRARLQPGGGVFPVAMSHAFDAALLGYLVGGFFVTVFYYPFFWINYAMTVALHNIVVTNATVGAGGITERLPLRGQPLRHGTT